MIAAAKTSWMERGWHPFLFAAYPVFYLMSRNMYYTGLSALVRPLVLVLLATGLAFAAARAVLRDSQRAGIVVTVGLVGFFTYALYDSAAWQIIVTVSGLFAVLAYVILGKRDWRPVSRRLNAFGIALLLVPGALMARSYSGGEHFALAPENPAPVPAANSPRPNIYYIILDGYGREDVLREYYDHDNAPFIAFLRAEGFHVDDQARANYPWTILSLASSLNYEHVTTMAAQLNLSGESLQPLIGLTRNNRVMAYLRGLGYDTHGFMPGYMRGNLVGADFVHRPWWAPTEFESALLDLTPVPPIMWKSSLPTAYDFHRRLQLESLDALDGLAQLPSPKFVFVHLLCPHPPFVLGPKGEPRQPAEARFTLKDGSAIVGSTMTRAEYVEGYRGQVQYLNARLEPAIRKLRREDPGAIMIIQGDHGPASMAHWTSVEDTNMRERLGILNAVCAPGAPAEFLEKFETPVNTFRLILSRYFDAPLEVLPDTSYFTLENAPYEFYPIEFDGEN